jgi:phasin
MTDVPRFEIPDTVRDLAERNMEQARAAYSQLLDATRKAQEVMTRSTTAMAGGVREVQERSLRYTQLNLDASFAFASERARARDPKEAMEIQAKFARQQMETYQEQAQELSRLIAATAQKSQPKP